MRLHQRRSREPEKSGSCVYFYQAELEKLSEVAWRAPNMSEALHSGNKKRLPAPVLVQFVPDLVIWKFKHRNRFISNEISSGGVYTARFDCRPIEQIYPLQQPIGPYGTLEVVAVLIQNSRQQTDKRRGDQCSPAPI